MQKHAKKERQNLEHIIKDTAEEDRAIMMRFFCLNQNREAVVQFLAKGVDINAKNEHGNTAIHHACMMEDIEMLDFLIQKGADLNITNEYDLTPAMLCAARGRYDMLQRLTISKKCLLNKVTTHSGFSALHFASKGGFSTCCRLLIRCGAIKNLPDASGLPPSVYAMNEATKHVFGVVTDINKVDAHSNVQKTKLKTSAS